MFFKCLKVELGSYWGGKTMEIIVHRRNTLQELKATPVQYGVEVDVRSCGDRLIIHHEPFVEGELIDNWLTAYQHGTLILNVKEEGRLGGTSYRADEGVSY
jgi:hypothetical protein